LQSALERRIDGGRNRSGRCGSGGDAKDPPCVEAPGFARRSQFVQ
jgi:hypothetical protein